MSVPAVLSALSVGTFILCEYLSLFVHFKNVVGIQEQVMFVFFSVNGREEMKGNVGTNTGSVICPSSMQQVKENIDIDVSVAGHLIRPSLVAGPVNLLRYTQDMHIRMSFSVFSDTVPTLCWL